MDVHCNIGKILKERGITQKQLAKELKMTEASISRYVSGARVPDAVTVLKIAIYAGCNVEDLYTLSPDADGKPVASGSPNSITVLQECMKIMETFGTDEILRIISFLAGSVADHGSVSQIP